MNSNKPRNPGEPLHPKDTPDNTVAIAGEASRPRNLPNRHKLGIDFSYDKRGRLHVRLSLPLDTEYPAEARAAELPIFGYERKKILDVRYVLDVDVTASMQGFSERIRELLSPATELGRVLREKVDLTAAQQQGALRHLAQDGRYLFNQLFEDIDIDEYKEIKLAAIKSVFSHKQIIHITNAEPLLPWGFLYHLPDEQAEAERYGLQTYDAENPAPDGFWGFMHEIQEELPCTSQTLPLPSDCKVVTSVCAIVDAEGWHKEDDHPLVTLGERVIHKSTEPELGRALSDFGWHCLYFFGHAHHSNNPSALTSWVKLLNIELTVAKLKTHYHAPQFRQKPVVAFLNGCSTAALNQWSKETFVGYLCESEHARGSVCCLVAIDSLPAALAAEFAKLFWRYFLCERQYIGSAILNARRDLLNKRKNPLGLLYSLFGRVDTRVEEGSDKEVERPAAAGVAAYAAPAV